MVDQDAIPAHILEMFNKEALKHKSPRQYRTKLINELFTKDAKTGKYEMAAHKPMFENYRMASSTKFGEEKMTGQPKSVFLYSYFHGNEAGLERAISMGDVQCWLKGGTEWCGFQQTSAGTRKENTYAQRLSGGEVDLNQEQFKVANKAFKNMAWSFEEAASSSASQRPLKEKQQKKVEEGFTNAMGDMVFEAKTSQEKLLQAAMKILAKAPAEETREVKMVIMKLKEMITKVEHVSLFKAGQ